MGLMSNASVYQLSFAPTRRGSLAASARLAVIFAARAPSSDFASPRTTQVGADQVDGLRAVFGQEIDVSE